MSLVSVAHATPKNSAAAKPLGGAAAMRDWQKRPLVDKLPYGDPHRMPTMQDAMNVLGVASSTAALTGQPNPFDVLHDVAARPNTLLRLAQANGKGLEWVTRNLRPLMGLPAERAK